MARTRTDYNETRHSWDGVSRTHLGAWCLYDWGNSAFAAIILSFVFAPYFTESVATNRELGSALWGQAMTISAIGIAIVSPIAGAFCDKGGRRKLWLVGFSAVAIIATALLWFVAPEARSVPLAIALVAIANFSFELGYVFYNAMLPSIVPKRMIGRASGWGWGVGYLGSLASIAVVLLVFVDGDLFDGVLNRDAAEHIRITAPFAALWFAIFASALFIIIPDVPWTGLSAGRIVREGTAEVLATLRHLKRLPSIAWYLVAHMVYIDGLNTLFIFGPIFAAGTIGLNEAELLLFGIGVYVAAGVGSIVFAWIDDWIGGRRLLILSLTAVCVTGTAVLLSTTATGFVAFSWIMSIFVGPVQSASRSLMGRLSPPGLRNQLFGLYSLAGRATAPLGPVAVGTLIAISGSQRIGLGLTVILMAVGGLLLIPVKEPVSEGTQDSSAQADR